MKLYGGMSTYFEFVESFEDSEKLIGNILATLIVLVAVFAINKLIRFLLKRFMNNQKTAGVIIRITSYFFIAAGLLFITGVWFDRAQSTAIVFGIILALTILAMRDLIQDIAAWFYIMGRDFFEIGDRLEIDGVKGDVTDIGLFHTFLSEVKGDLLDKEADTGRYISIPNSFVFNKPFINYTHDHKFVWLETYVTIDYQSDYKEALRVAGVLAYELYEDMMARYEGDELEAFKKESTIVEQGLKPSIRAAVGNHGLDIYITFFCRYNDIGGIRNHYKFALWEALRAHDFKIVYADSLVVEHEEMRSK